MLTFFVSLLTKINKFFLNKFFLFNLNILLFEVKREKISVSNRKNVLYDGTRE